MTTRIRVALADDHPIVLDGLEQLFRLQDDMTVVARCCNADEALRAVRGIRPDVLVLDLLMPGASGLELLRALNDDDATRQTRVVLLTAVADDDQLLEAIRLGAQGVVLKEMAPQLLLDAVREVHAGAQWLEEGLGGRALRRLPKSGPFSNSNADSGMHRRSVSKPTENFNINSYIIIPIVAVLCFKITDVSFKHFTTKAKKLAGF